MSSLFRQPPAHLPHDVIAVTDRHGPALLGWLGSAQRVITTNHPTNGHSAVDRLRRELEQLAEEQLGALRKSVFGGMTPAEASQYAERRAKINRLSKELASLNGGQRVPE